MTLRMSLFQVVLVVLLATMQTKGQITSVMPMFILDSAPLSLDASIVAVNRVPTETAYRIVTYSVDCPSSKSPENDACRAQSIYPAEVWHTQGSVWGGTTTARLDDSTTDWMCNLASRVCPTCTLPTQKEGPFCIKSITAPGAVARVETTWLDACYVTSHTVPLLVTGGVDKLPSNWYFTYGVSQLHSIYGSAMSSLGCVASSKITTATGIAASTTGITAPNTSSGSGSRTTVTGGAALITSPPISGGQASTTRAVGSSSSLVSTSRSSRTSRELSWLPAIVAVAMYLVV